ncbi:uncharacterized protein HD556DRAFT_1441294 [Suillus plorans]|uniref:Uncharacterized protein n=1 Tax=Suillus plorans TaxID=116603 RepID=A0A9P7DKP8_9AGAM|nr:uncharacterized protein HD556DRAFT_1441294 [Suillus plorans]KAG1797139.1 hypothetical protein HD556DRAFT_1441294 [Suillus plorans]
MPRTKIITGDQPRLNDQETTTLQSHVEDWEKASGTEQRQIFKVAAREAKLFAPKMDKELLKQRKERYRQWFYNHKKPKKWTARRVIEEERKADILQQIHEEIEEETGQKPEQKEVLRRYQPTMTAIMKGLNDDELEEARAKADQWTNQVPDPVVQAKTAKKKGAKNDQALRQRDVYSGQYETLFDMLGRLVIVLTWFGRFDFNEHLGRGSSFMKCKDWQVILPAWEDFIGDEFDQDQDQDGTLLGGTRRVPKPHYEFDLDRMDLPILPDIKGVSLEVKKAMIRSFLTIHYRICCGKRKVPVPWSDIMKGQSRFISSTYLPNDIKITDPSKMQRNEANALLECWLDRQDHQVGLMLKFKAWIDDKGKMHSPVGEGSDGSDADADDEGLWPRPTAKSSAATALSSVRLPKRPPRFIKRAHIGSADEDSNNTDASNRVEKDAITAHSDQVGRESESDDRPRPKSLRKRATIEPAIISLPTDFAQMGRPVVELVRKVTHNRQATTAGRTGMPIEQVTEGSADESGGNTAPKADYDASGAHHCGQHIRSFGPHSTRRGMEHLLATPVANDRLTKKTKATRNISPAVNDGLPKKSFATRDRSPAVNDWLPSPAVNDRLPKKSLAARDRSPAVNDRSPKKTKATRSAARSLSDAPARSTRSKIDNGLGARIRQKPKRYADYV